MSAICEVYKGAGVRMRKESDASRCSVMSNKKSERSECRKCTTEVDSAQKEARRRRFTASGARRMCLAHGRRQMAAGRHMGYA